MLRIHFLKPCVSQLQVYVQVLNINEHRPIFLEPLYEVRERAG